MRILQGALLALVLAGCQTTGVGSAARRGASAAHGSPDGYWTIEAVGEVEAQQELCDEAFPDGREPTRQIEMGLTRPFPEGTTGIYTRYECRPRH